MTSSSAVAELKKLTFPFENIVLEGGGSKGVSYIGFMQVLEETGIMENIKRFAGVSMGSIFATLMALGFTSKEIQELSRKITLNSFLDSSWGYWSLLPNLLFHYGWHSGNKFKQTMSEIIESKFGKCGLTFGELYYEHGRELCIVAANVSASEVEYFHPKTTPKLAIVEALAMSIAIPFLMKPKLCNVNGRDEFFVDGGTLNNFPVSCFDGWYLNMLPQYSFLNRDNLEEEQSGWFDSLTSSIKEKTIGVLVFSQNEREVFKKEFSARLADYPVIRPATPMVRESVEMVTKVKDSYNAQVNDRDFVHRLVAQLRKKQTAGSTVITKQQISSALQDMSMTEVDYKLMFSETIPEQIVVNELSAYFSQKGIPLHHGRSGNVSKQIRSFSDFYALLLDGIMVRHKNVVVKGDDIQRIVGIDTDYVNIISKLEDGDIDFMIRQGRNATVAMLKEFAEKREKGTLLWTD